MVYPNVISINPKNFGIEICIYDSTELFQEEVELVFDLNQFHNVVGIEILNLKLELGNQCLNLIDKYITTNGDIRYSYDTESDSFYLQLSDENSFDQEAVIGVVSLNSNKEILKMEIKGSAE